MSARYARTRYEYRCVGLPTAHAELPTPWMPVTEWQHHDALLEWDRYGVRSVTHCAPHPVHAWQAADAAEELANEYRLNVEWYDGDKLICAGLVRWADWGTSGIAGADDPALEEAWA